MKDLPLKGICFTKINGERDQGGGGGRPQGASHGGSEKPGKLEVGGASRDSTGLGALEEGLISS